MHDRRTRRVRRRWISLFILVPALLAGCGGKDTILPQEGATMQDIYNGHFGVPGAGGGGSSPADGDTRWSGPSRAGDSDLLGYTREAQSEIRSIFPLLPNPILVMYVYPHLTGNGHPVPGYSTSFPMYERVEYALPGEVEGW